VIRAAGLKKKVIECKLVLCFRYLFVMDAHNWPTSLPTMFTLPLNNSTFFIK
jgi:hypothetical protein